MAYNDETDDRYWIDTATNEAVAQLLVDVSTGATLNWHSRGTLQGIAQLLHPDTETERDGFHWPIMVVDEKEGGVIAYAPSRELAVRIAEALDAFEG